MPRFGGLGRVLHYGLDGGVFLIFIGRSGWQGSGGTRRRADLDVTGDDTAVRAGRSRRRHRLANRQIAGLRRDKVAD